MTLLFLRASTIFEILEPEIEIFLKNVNGSGFSDILPQRYNEGQHMLKISVDLQMDWYEWWLLQTKHHPGLGYPAWVLGNISSSFSSKRRWCPHFVRQRMWIYIPIWHLNVALHLSIDLHRHRHLVTMARFFLDERSRKFTIRWSGSMCEGAKACFLWNFWNLKT